MGTVTLAEGDDFSERFVGADNRKVYFLNTSAETIPPFGIVQISTPAYVNDRPILRAIKPTTTLGEFVINGSTPVEVNKVGCAQNGDFLTVAGATTGITIDSNVGVNGWYADVLPTGKPLLDIAPVALHDSTRKLFVAKVQPLKRILFKAASGGISGRVGAILGSGTCELLSIANSNKLISLSGCTTTVYNWATAAACSSGERYGVGLKINNSWVVVAEDCKDTGNTIQSLSTTTTTTPTKTDPIQTGSMPVLGTAGSLTHAEWYGLGVGSGYE